MTKFLKITDFAKEVGKHTNTVDNWFKLLEEKRLHYVNRVNDEKVYDELDLSIAIYIRDKRNDKWALEAICNELADAGTPMELRPFPEEIETTTALQVPDMESFKSTFMAEIRALADEIAAAQVSEIRKQHEETIRMLPAPRDPAEERKERLNQALAQRRVERALESEALHMWFTKPEEERIRRVGLFRKEEDAAARDRFVRDYVDAHFEDRMRKEFEA